MPVLSADYASVITECREALGRGGALEGKALIRVIDVIQHAANTLDSQGAATGATTRTAVLALEALLVTHMAIWNAAKGGATATEYAAALAALATPRTTCLSASLASAVASTATVTDVTANNTLDGRFA